MITDYYYMIVPQPQPQPPSSKAADRRQTATLSLDRSGGGLNLAREEKKAKRGEGRWDLESDVLEDNLLDVAADGGAVVTASPRWSL